MTAGRRHCPDCFTDGLPEWLLEWLIEWLIEWIVR